MKTTRSRRAWAIVLVLVPSMALVWVLAQQYRWEGRPEVPKMHLDPSAPPLVFFERASQIDPGTLRILIKVQQPVLRRFREALAGSVTAAIVDGPDEARRELVAFTEVWQHENVMEIRVPLTAVAEGGRLVRCVVDSLDHEFILRPRDVPPARVDVTEISFPTVAERAFVTITNRIDEPIEIDEVRINGRSAVHSAPIRLPADARARLMVRGVPAPAGDVSVVLQEHGTWIEAHEVAEAPAFTLLDWDGDDPGLAGALEGSGALGGDGGAMLETAVDVGTTEAARAMTPGSYLFDFRSLIREATERTRPAGARKAHGGPKAVRPHALVFLNDGGRPASHFIYGRLGDFVGVAALDPRLSTTDLRDVAFWLRMDRVIVEPRHLLALPGVLRRSSPLGNTLNEQDLRRLVLASLSVGPRGLVYYRPEGDPTVVSAGESPLYGQAVAAINAELEPLRPLLSTAIPVEWIYKEGGTGPTKDRYGTTGFFALWCGEDRLVILALGYTQHGWLSLPESVRIVEGLSGDVEILGDPEWDGRIALNNPTPEGPGMAVFGLRVDFFEDGDVRWLPF